MLVAIFGMCAIGASSAAAAPSYLEVQLEGAKAGGRQSVKVSFSWCDEPNYKYALAGRSGVGWYELTVDVTGPTVTVMHHSERVQLQQYDCTRSSLSWPLKLASPASLCARVTIRTYFGSTSRRTCSTVSHRVHGSLAGVLAFRKVGDDSNTRSIYCYLPDTRGHTAEQQPMLRCTWVFGAVSGSEAIDLPLSGRASPFMDNTLDPRYSVNFPRARFKILRRGQTWRWRCKTGGMDCGERKGRSVFECTNEGARLTCSNSAGHGFSVKRAIVDSLDPDFETF